MEKALLNKKHVKCGLKNSIRDGTASGAATGITGTYLIPFALALGANAAQIGLLTALPQLASTLLQPFAGSITEHAGSRKKICKAVLFLARIAWVPIILLAFIKGFDAFSLLLIFVSISAAASSFARPAWASWMGDLVPEKTRGRYFGKRNMYAGAAAFIASLSAGWLLGFLDSLAGFAIIFLAAAVLYFIGLHYLLKMPEPAFQINSHKGHKIRLNVSEFLSSMKKSNFRHFMLYAMVFDFSVYLASPFFSVYMISELNIGYWWFAIISAASIVSSIVSQKYWGKLSDRYGDKNVMIICAMLASLVPLIFVFSRSVPLLVLANVFSGFAWAGLDLVIFNFLLDSSPPLKRPLFISNYQFFDGLAIASGSIVGGILISLMGTGFLWMSGIAAVFLLSSVLRAVFSATLIPRIKEERIKSRKVLPARDVFMRAVVIYPVRGISHEIDYAHYCLKCWEKKAKKDMKGLSKVLSIT